MVWKQDLAKLKRELKDAGEPTGPPKPARPAPRLPAGPQPLENEDALFLAAMGHRPPKPAPAEPGPANDKPQPAREAPEADFASTMSSLKGLKRKASRLPTAENPPKAAPAAPAASVPEVQAEEAPAPTAPPPDVVHAPSQVAAELPSLRPSLIHLAAGMAIDVDGSLDLRGHNPQDAVERLTERVMDGVCLGWRTLHVILGASEELRQAFHAFLDSPGAHFVSRYAQAPIPMGGSQAWILYYAVMGAAPRLEQP